MARFFIDRPIFAAVISLVITLSGLMAVLGLPIAQYPEITPPTIQVSCFYPGANSEVVANSVATAIEQQIVGVENMLYMSSQCTNDGGYSLTVTFEVGTDLDMAQVLVQNRVNLALPSLPVEVKQTGVNVKKKSPSILMLVNLTSPDGTYDQLYLSNYATLRLRDALAQIPGVGDVSQLGQMDYSMRAWLDPEKMAVRGITASDVVNSLKEQNIQVAAGALGRPPIERGQAFQYSLSTKGRLVTPEEFEGIIVKTNINGVAVHLREIVTDTREADGRKWGGIQLGAKNEDTACYLDGRPSVGLAIYQQPGSNALATADAVRAEMARLKGDFPPGLEYGIVYDTTPFIDESIHEVFKALRDAIVLVAIVVLVFLQSWRATLIPLIAVPVAIVGTFAAMAALGFSLNNLSLFGLVLAIGIVVDDAIVVVEAVEHHIAHGLAPREAALRAMDEVSGPIIAISLVLMCVFVPCVFITGITGQFFKQFALTIAVSTFFSAINSLTLSPALSALLLRSKETTRDPLSLFLGVAFGWFFRLFNSAFTRASNAYARLVGGLCRVSLLVLLAYGGLLYLTYAGFQRVPTGFIPTQDKGYLLIDIRLPDSASIERTRRVVEIVDRMARGEGDAKIEGVDHTIGIVGQSFVQNAVGSNFGSMFVILEGFEDRHDRERSADAIAARIRAACYVALPEASVAVFGAPPVDGLGSAGGFKAMVRDTSDLGLRSLQQAGESLAQSGNQTPGLLGMFSGFRAEAPQMFVEVDREKCRAIGMPLNEVYLSLQTFLGGYYVNDFNQFGRTWQVQLQADPAFRRVPGDVARIKARNVKGEMVPLGSVTAVREMAGPALITRYNGVNAAAINGGAAPGMSSGSVVRAVEGVAAKELGQGFDLQWTELTLLQLRAGNTAMIVFGLSVVLVFLVLAAQYESWSLPLAVVLVVPMCLLCSVIGVAIASLDINIFVQIGLIVLVGLASKNAILIVEFAKEKQSQGVSAMDATVEACRMRLRPIMMTSFAFILGVLPMAIATGAGAEMRRALGIAVFSGMLGVTFFGIFLTPVFYYAIMRRRAS